MVFEFYLDAYMYLLKKGFADRKPEKIGWKQWKVTLPGDNK
jgi:hypothetical protein